MVKLSLTVKIPELFPLFSHKHMHHKTNIHVTNIFYNISQFKFYFTFFLLLKVTLLLGTELSSTLIISAKEFLGLNLFAACKDFGFFYTNGSM